VAETEGVVAVKLDVIAATVMTYGGLVVPAVLGVGIVVMSEQDVLVVLDADVDVATEAIALPPLVVIITFVPIELPVLDRVVIAIAVQVEATTPQLVIDTVALDVLTLPLAIVAVAFPVVIVAGSTVVAEAPSLVANDTVVVNGVVVVVSHSVIVAESTNVEIVDEEEMLPNVELETWTVASHVDQPPYTARFCSVLPYATW
jgi:hypothetical protein